MMLSYLAAVALTAAVFLLFISGSLQIWHLYITGPGAGMSLMFVIAGALGILVGVIGFMVPAVRSIEEILPDHQPGTSCMHTESSASTHDGS